MGIYIVREGDVKYGLWEDGKRLKWLPDKQEHSKEFAVFDKLLWLLFLFYFNKYIIYFTLYERKN